MFKKIGQFLKEVLNELKKVTWLGRKETLGVTVVVIILVAVIAVFAAAVDFILAKLLGLLIK